jgi:hypothetical protein
MCCHVQQLYLPSLMMLDLPEMSLPHHKSRFLLVPTLLLPIVQ